MWYNTYNESRTDLIRCRRYCVAFFFWVQHIVVYYCLYSTQQDKTIKPIHFNNNGREKNRGNQKPPGDDEKWSYARARREPVETVQICIVFESIIERAYAHRFHMIRRKMLHCGAAANKHKHRTPYHTHNTSHQKKKAYMQNMFLEMRARSRF